MKKTLFITFQVCLAVLAATAKLEAQSPQCGIQTDGTAFCCKKPVPTLPSEGVSGGNYQNQYFRCPSPCNMIYMSSSFTMSYFFASFRSPEWIEKLNGASEDTHMLVASCKGGLVPYHVGAVPSLLDFDHRIRTLSLSITQKAGE